MNINEKNKMYIIFTPEANSALDGLIKNFNLEETPEEFLRKAKEKIPCNIVIIDHLAKDFAWQVISEKNLVDSLQKKIGISIQIAEQISKEITTKIIPLLKKVTGSEESNSVGEENGLEDISVTAKKPDFSDVKKELKNFEEVEKKYNNNKPRMIEDTGSVVGKPIKKLLKNVKLSENAENINKPPKGPEKLKSSGSDKYRELIG